MPNPQTPGDVWTEQKRFASDGNAQAWFGSALAISGSTALIGARNATVDSRPGQGSVYVFKKIDGIWTQTQKLTADDGAAGDGFGASIALLGTIAIITAPTARVASNTWQGAAYVFSLTAPSPTPKKTWRQVQKLVADDGSAFETFGVSVAINSKFAFFGAGGANHAGQYVPRLVHVFKRGPGIVGGDWTQTQTIDNPVPEDVTSSFGASLAISDTDAFIGARASMVDGKIGQGRVYTATESAGNWILTGKLRADDGEARDNFGVSIGLASDTALIGSPGASINANISQGAVYRFVRSGTSWSQRQKITASDGTALCLFGASVSLCDATAVIGAYAQKSYQGVAYVFEERQRVWAQVQTLAASDAQAGDVFGYYTALDKSTALVGAYAKDVGTNAKQGVAYFFARPGARRNS